MSKRLTITVPDDVYEALKAEAEAEFRTLSGELTYLLKQRKANEEEQ